MNRKSPQKMSLWICLERRLGARFFGCQDRGSRFGQRHTECGGIWGSVLLRKLHLRYVCGVQGMAPLSRGRTQSAPGNPQWASGMSSQVHGIWRPSIGIVRNPKPCARRGRPRCKGHDGEDATSLFWCGTRLGGGEPGWTLCCFNFSQDSLKQWEGVCGERWHWPWELRKAGPRKLGDQFCSIPVISVPEKWKDKY